MAQNVSSGNYIKRSIRIKVTLGIVLPLILFLGIFTVIEYTRQRDAVLDKLAFLAAQTSQVIENSLQHAMLTRNLEALQETLTDIGANELIQVVSLMDTSGRVIFSPDATGTGTQLDNLDPTCQACHKLPPEERPSSVVITLPGNQRVFRSMNPIENKPECQICHDTNQRLNGLLLTDISMAPLEEPLKSDLIEKILWWAGSILATVIIVNLAINRLVLNRIEGLADSLASFGQESFEPHLPTGSQDEIGQLTSAFNEMGQRIESETSENRTLSEHLRRQSAMRGELLNRLITAQEDERKRVARELHDELGQALAGLALRTEVMDQLIRTDPQSALEQLNENKLLIDETTLRMYDLILALRPSVLDDLGLAAALREHTGRQLNGTGISIDIDTSLPDDRLPPEIEIALYRTFQEALNNIIRHAEATKVLVRLHALNGVCEVEIEDDGKGFDPEKLQDNNREHRGFGLLGIQERITLCGGTFHLESKPGCGTRIKIQIPLNEGNYG